MTTWPEITAIVIGFAAWAWLRPSFVGLLISAVGVGLAIRRLYLSQKNEGPIKSPRHDNTRQSNSIPEESA